MKCVLFSVLVTAVVFLCCVSTAQSAQRRGPWFSKQPLFQPHTQSPPHDPPRQYPDHGRYPAYSSPDLYPQYYGGFHYRHLFYYGMPTGDLPTRGMPW